MAKHNVRIREALAKNDFPVWYLQKILNISESSVTRMMRDELPEEEQKRIVSLISDYSQKG